MRRELTDDRKRLHNKTHKWSREHYRELIRRDVHGHLASGERAAITVPATAKR